MPSKKGERSEAQLNEFVGQRYTTSTNFGSEQTQDGLVHITKMSAYGDRTVESSSVQVDQELKDKVEQPELFVDDRYSPSKKLYLPLEALQDTFDQVTKKVSKNMKKHLAVVVEARGPNVNAQFKIPIEQRRHDSINSMKNPNNKKYGTIEFNPVPKAAGLLGDFGFLEIGMESEVDGRLVEMEELKIAIGPKQDEITPEAAMYIHPAGLYIRGQLFDIKNPKVDGKRKKVKEVRHRQYFVKLSLDPMKGPITCCIKLVSRDGDVFDTATVTADGEGTIKSVDFAGSKARSVRSNAYADLNGSLSDLRRSIPASSRDIRRVAIAPAIASQVEPLRPAEDTTSSDGMSWGAVPPLPPPPCDFGGLPIGQPQPGFSQTPQTHGYQHQTWPAMRPLGPMGSMPSMATMQQIPPVPPLPRQSYINFDNGYTNPADMSFSQQALPPPPPHMPTGAAMGSTFDMNGGWQPFGSVGDWNGAQDIKPADPSQFNSGGDFYSTPDWGADAGFPIDGDFGSVAPSFVDYNFSSGDFAFEQGAPSLYSHIGTHPNIETKATTPFRGSRKRREIPDREDPIAKRQRSNPGSPEMPDLTEDYQFNHEDDLFTCGADSWDGGFNVNFNGFDDFSRSDVFA